MNYGHCRCIKSLSVLIMVLVTMISAEPVGYVVKQGGQWVESAVSVYELSSKKDYLIDNGKCYGPVFSPDGRKVAYAKVVGNSGDIFIKNSDGTGEAKALGLDIPTPFKGGKTEPCMNWVILDGVEYLYWSEAAQDIYRTPLVNPEKKSIFKTTKTKRLICISVSKDAKRAGCTIPGYSAAAIDLVTGELSAWSGCQGSISWSGKYVTHNLGGHTECLIHDFESGDEIGGKIHSPTGKFNWQRFSHHTDDYFCVSVNETKAYICEWKTKKYTEVGPGAPLDYYPNEIPGFGHLDQAVGTITVAKQSAQENVLNIPSPNIITVNSSKPYRISIANLSGREQYQYSNSTPCTLQLQQTGLTQGIYVIRLETGNKVITKTMSYVKVR